MAFTDHCDVFASLHEDGINRAIQHAMRQRPSLFNIATPHFNGPGRDDLCHPINAHPEVTDRDNPLLTVEAPFPVPGTGDVIGMHYCLQVTKLAVDFHPKTDIELPDEFEGGLKPQGVGLHLRVCAGIGCPDQTMIAYLSEADELPQGEVYVPVTRTHCFCIDLFTTGSVKLTERGNRAKLSMDADQIEIVDISPEGLENGLECMLLTMIKVALLPKLRIGLDFLTFELGSFGSMVLTPTQRNRRVPQNPNVADNATSVFVDVQVV